MTHQEERRADARPGIGRSATAALFTVLVVGAVLQALHLAHEWRSNPFARDPLNDARVYWDWAGDLAAGHWIGGAPYFSAPLYPHLAGIVRAFGGDLLALYVAQACVHLATAALLFRIGLRRAGLAAATTAALAWVLLDDAGYSTARVLNGGVQCLTVVWLLDRALGFQERRSAASAALLGLALGLATLANPVLLALIPLAAAWCAWIAPAGARAKPALACALVALASIAPATVHNALASGEFVPVSAQAGVTFFHGNAPGADGTYKPIPGVSTDRIKQNLDARELVRGETDGSWNATSSAWFRRGLAFWRAEPGAAIELAGRKLWWFLTGRNYGDIYLPVLENEEGFSRSERFAPLPAAWLAFPALVAAAFLLRDARRRGPELLLLLVPLATVVVFWYSPRYRLPAMPVACLLVACAFFGPGGALRRVACGVALVAAMLAGPLNTALHFDDPESTRAQYEYHAGKALADEDRLAEAARRFRAAVRLGHAEANAALGDVLRRQGRPSDALELLRDNALRQPTSSFARRSLAVALAQAREFPAARAEFEAAIALDPNDWESLSGLGGVFYELGDLTKAAETLRKALRVRPEMDGAHYNLGVVLEAQNDLENAALEYAAALQLNPELARAAHKLAILRVAADDVRGALRELTYGLEHSPKDRDLATTCAWLLSTAPDAADRDGAKALALVQPWCDAEPGDPGLWNIRAAALAELGRFQDAVRSCATALELTGPDMPAEARTELAKRLELYRQGRPYRLPRR
ncbi:MAG: tetratricopeptide repeat protein [Planctomycetota bacterium]